MKHLTQTITKTLLTLLLTWSWTALAQETDNANTTTGATTSAYNWVNLPDQNPLKSPVVAENFGRYPQLIDFDGDGDFEMFDGIYYYENLGSAEKPTFKTPPTKITKEFLGGAKINAIFTYFVPLWYKISQNSSGKQLQKTQQSRSLNV